MMRSLNSAVAGLRTHQTKMDVIGNNIANVNTYGFKTSRTTFNDIFYQNLGAAAAPGTTVGGTNPTQIGYGSAVATIDILNTQSGASSTDRAMDVYIGGDGFLVTVDAMGNYQYTRLGNLGFDAAGNLVDGKGGFVMGFPLNADRTPRVNSDGSANPGDLTQIWCDPNILDQLTSISIGTNGEIVGTLPGDTVAVISAPSWMGDDASVSISPTSTYRGPVRLNIGGLPDMSDTASFGLGTNNITGVHFGERSLSAGDATHDTEITVDAQGNVTIQGWEEDSSGNLTAVKLTGTLKNGKIEMKNSSGYTYMTIETDAAAGTKLDEVTTTTLALDEKYEITTKDIGGNVVRLPDGGPGDAADLAAGATINVGDITFTLGAAATVPSSYAGTIATAKAGESELYTIGCIVLAKFRNAAGMQQAGNSKFIETSNSGEPQFYRPGVQGTGDLSAGYLEMSNVDISKEFTEMITTQRGFQANTRIVTVSDEMLQELVNLKR